MHNCLDKPKQNRANKVDKYLDLIRTQCDIAHAKKTHISLEQPHQQAKKHKIPLVYNNTFRWLIVAIHNYYAAAVIISQL